MPSTSRGETFGRTIGALALLAGLMTSLLTWPAAAAAGLYREWRMEVSVQTEGGLSAALDSSVSLGGTTGPIFWSGYSEWRQGVGLLWQELRVCGMRGDLWAEGSALFGPVTGDFLYAQLSTGFRVCGLDMGLCGAVLGEAVLGGPSCGLAMRVEGTLGEFRIVSTTELGARLEDEECDGVVIVHAPTGFRRHFPVDPLSHGAERLGEKLVLDGAGFDRVGRVQAAFHLSAAGVDLVALQLREIGTGVPWAELGLKAMYDASAGRLAAVPEIRLCRGLISVEPRLGLCFGGVGGSVEAVGLGGVAVRGAWGGASICALTLLDPARWVIATAGGESFLEAADEAVEEGHDYDPDCRSLVSLDRSWVDARGRAASVLVTARFGRGSAGQAWTAGCVQVLVGLTPEAEVSARVATGVSGVNGIAAGITLRW